MKTKLFTAILLTVVCLAFVGGATHAQSPTYTTYLPLVAKPPCSPKVTAYVVASDPVVRVGEIVTLTGAIVNECAGLVGQPYFRVRTDPVGILSSTIHGTLGSYAVPIGEYRELTLTMLAVGTGPITLTAHIDYESVNDDYYPPPFYWVFVLSDPIVVRVLPSLQGD